MERVACCVFRVQRNTQHAAPFNSTLQRSNAPTLPFSSTIPVRVPQQWHVRTCVIFNPTARGDKARHLRAHLDELARQCTLKLTAAVGDARRLATEAVSEGFQIVVAAGGDGTLNEVLNGIADAPNGLARARLGLLPLGTVNVFAREMSIPTRLEAAWQAIRRGKESLIDLPNIEYDAKGVRQRRCFAQLAGAGLDASAIELVHWPLKKKIGPLAYVVAGLKRSAETPIEDHRRRRGAFGDRRVGADRQWPVVWGTIRGLSRRGHARRQAERMHLPARHVDDPSPLWAALAAESHPALGRSDTFPG